MRREYKRINILLDTKGSNILEGSFKTIRKKLINLEKKYKLKGFRNLEIEIEIKDITSILGPCVIFIISGERLETDDEYNYRKETTRSIFN